MSKNAQQPTKKSPREPGKPRLMFSRFAKPEPMPAEKQKE